MHPDSSPSEHSRSLSLCLSVFLSVCLSLCLSVSRVPQVQSPGVISSAPCRAPWASLRRASLPPTTLPPLFHPLCFLFSPVHPSSEIPRAFALSESQDRASRAWQSPHCVVSAHDDVSHSGRSRGKEAFPAPGEGLRLQEGGPANRGWQVDWVCIERINSACRWVIWEEGKIRKNRKILQALALGHSMNNLLFSG